MAAAASPSSGAHGVFYFLDLAQAAVSFRDAALLSVFTAALAELRRLAPAAGAATPPPDARLLDAAVSLALACLSYDFVGTCLDESGDDLGTVQVPSSWRSALCDGSTCGLFFDVYAAAAPPLSATALECLVRLASVRRSLFGCEAERAAFLASLVGGTRRVLAGRVGLDAHANFHEFCRLLGRLK